MRVCHIVPGLELRHGGPSVSVPSLVQALGQAGHEVTLLTTGDVPERVRAAVPVRTFPRSWPAMLGCSTGLAAAARAEPAEIVHHHALWLRTLHYAQDAARRRDVPLVISPRGMMTPWAWNHHRGRKRFAAACIHPGAFAAASGWHATSDDEAKGIRDRDFRQPVCVAPNGIAAPDASALAAARSAWIERWPALAHRPVALFYSRFHQKKRLEELVTLWNSTPRGEWLLLIVGVPEEFSVAEIRAWIENAGAQDRIQVFDGTDAPPPYAVANLFLLPSHSENFGLVIGEAMAAGVPVVVTDTTPWSAVNPEGLGWCVAWDRFDRALAEALASGRDALTAQGARAREWVLREFSWTKAAQRLSDFYRSLRSGSA